MRKSNCQFSGLHDRVPRQQVFRTGDEGMQVENWEFSGMRPQPAQVGTLANMKCTGTNTSLVGTRMHRRAPSQQSTVRCTMPPVPPGPDKSITNPCNNHEAPGPLQSRGASMKHKRRPMAIGYPITRPQGNGCIDVDPHHRNNPHNLAI